MNQTSARLIAFYLPQFHPIPENDEWWGNGFTEWTNVAKARPLFPGHYQPHVPADLGFYDLRVPETRQAQADLARKAGIEGFCYWHYWFAGKRLLERPFNEVLSSGEPDFPFCLGWANQSWSGIWHGSPKKILIQQTYPGPEDHERHFYANLPAFQDARYIRVEGKPLFLIHSPEELLNPEAFFEQWRNLALKNGLLGIHFVANLFHGHQDYNPEQLGFDAVTICNPSRIRWGSKFEIALARLNMFSNNGGKPSGWPSKILAAAGACKRKALSKYRQLRGYPTYVYDYADAMLFFQETDLPFKTVYPSVIPNWDNSPRSGGRATILTNSTPELFRRHLRDALRQAADLPAGRRIVFVKSWNEWAEGNYLEPDLKFGHRYLDVVREEVLTGSRLVTKV
jgi:lipopolysaccharide biosynthesis protein